MVLERFQTLQHDVSITDSKSSRGKCAGELAHCKPFLKINRSLSHYIHKVHLIFHLEQFPRERFAHAASQAVHRRSPPGASPSAPIPQHSGVDEIASLGLEDGSCALQRCYGWIERTFSRRQRHCVDRLSASKGDVTSLLGSR